MRVVPFYPRLLQKHIIVIGEGDVQVSINMRVVSYGLKFIFIFVQMPVKKERVTKLFKMHSSVV